MSIVINANVNFAKVKDMPYGVSTRGSSVPEMGSLGRNPETAAAGTAQKGRAAK